jgi:hypothetical protein
VEVRFEANSLVEEAFPSARFVEQTSLNIAIIDVLFV